MTAQELPDADSHSYLSTGCLHGRHDYCQSTHGGRKRPGECKFCGAPCLCSCHEASRCGMSVPAAEIVTHVLALGNPMAHALHRWEAP